MTFLSQSPELLLSISEDSFSLFTMEGFAISDRSMKAIAGDKVAYSLFGVTGIGLLTSDEIITEEGEVIEGGLLEEVIMLGKVTFEILRTHDSNRPVI